MPPFSTHTPIEYIKVVFTDADAEDHEYNYDVDDEMDVIDTINNEEDAFLENHHCEEGKYYLGTIEYHPSDSDHLLLAFPISLPTFFKHKIEVLENYADTDICILQFYTHPIQIQTADGEMLVFVEHCAIDKTYWLRMFQRQCRRWVASRKNWRRSS